ncbi:glucose-1-phosphate thymidylyltransferase [Panacibacter ginsenosidivorans]|uniref:Glucose-1-phosphate thymidylyltransferase n=1 Tax=Panacibacter ginsenosidivorans TaxID=1813871 RepID=A0A5B8V386_9BACT|nr:putative sugar nucleotidyl transferase [Panacibacter ginsenosidivorans]QEC65824.1 glucose-1-phosphate thymidylyltransferase [Panacibacter ginsenosidivorans]
MSIVLFDNTDHKHLYPLNNACAVADLRVGICTAKGRWELLLKQTVHVHTEDYLSLLYGPIPSGSHYWIDASILPDTALAERILSLNENEALADTGGLIAGKKNFDGANFPRENLLNSFETICEYETAKRIFHAWDMFELNDHMLRSDFDLLTKDRQSRPLPQGNQYINPENIFVEEGATISCAIINASAGPVYIGKNATIMEGALIRGPFAMCNDSVIKMGAKIYGATTLGPCCVAGGEIKNAILQGYSNKSHDGYLGDAVIGKWCNLGAGTTNSNVKNTASMVKMWNTVAQDYIEANIKCGVVMGDYSRTAINTSINTGSVIGTCCNIFGEGLLPKYIPDFQWGSKGITRYELEKSFKDIDNWKKMKGQSLSDAEKRILQYIFETT